MSRACRGESSGGGRSSLGYLFEPEPEDIAPDHSTKSTREINKSPKDNIIFGYKMANEEADQEIQVAPLKKEDSNPIISNRAASNIYHTNNVGNNSGLLITNRPSTRVRCAPGGPSSLGFLFGDEDA
uniref:Protein SPIRAL1-like 5 n=1 Tax=Leersia perrieri TaxID=77586 RepID=A0A0D9W8H5_9ORYZ